MPDAFNHSTGIKRLSEKEQPNLELLSDEDLMLLYKGGDDESFDCLYKRYKDKKRYLTLRFGSKEQAENFFHQTWLQIIKTKDQYEKKGKFNSYFETTLKNLTTDELRRSPRAKTKVPTHDETQLDKPQISRFTGKPLKKHELKSYEKESKSGQGYVGGDQGPVPEPDELASRDSTEKTVALQNCVDALEMALPELPPEQRDALLLKLETDMTLEEIGDVMSVGREAIKSRLRYAVDKIKKSLPEDCWDKLA